MRKLLTLLILGILLGFVLYEYLKILQLRNVRPMAVPADLRGAESSTGTSRVRQWQGTDDKQPFPLRDDLTLINGIGPAFEKALNAIGIFTFAQLAEQDARGLADKMKARITVERIRRDRWIEQARELARSG